MAGSGVLFVCDWLRKHCIRTRLVERYTQRFSFSFSWHLHLTRYTANSYPALARLRLPMQLIFKHPYRLRRCWRHRLPGN